MAAPSKGPPPKAQAPQQAEEPAEQGQEPEQNGKKQVYYTRKYHCPGGLIVLDVDWKMRQNQDGQEYPSWFAKVKKIYKGKDKKWTATDFFQPEEMPIAAAALLHGYEVIVSARNQE